MGLVLLVPLVPLVVLTACCLRRRAPTPCRRTVPRELIRSALAIIPADADAGATQRAVDRVVGTDARVDVVVVEVAVAGRPALEHVAPRVTVLRPAIPCTTANALRVGAARGMRSDYDAVIEVPVGHSRLARRITPLLDALEDGAHVALASRYVPGGRVLECGPVRRLASRGANSALRRVTRLPVHDVTARIRAYRREAVRDALLRAHGDGQSFGVDVLLRCRSSGLHVTEVPVTAAACECATTSLADARGLFARVVRSRRPRLLGGDREIEGVGVAEPAAAPTVYDAPRTLTGQGGYAVR